MLRMTAANRPTPSRVPRASAETAPVRDSSSGARRSVRRTLRQPALIVPTIIFPLLLLAINASGLGSATKIPGFPASSYLDFSITVCFMQGALFSAITAGTELATDIQSGFLNTYALWMLVGLVAAITWILL